MSRGRSFPSSLALVAIAALVGASAFWLFDALPFQDLPAHAGILAMRRRFATSAFEQRYYAEGASFGPYAVFLWLGDALAALVGPLRAVRALGCLPVLATPAALLHARRRLHGDDGAWAGFFGVALSFGFMTLLGLASYLLALALFVVALAEWLELLADVDRGAPRPARAVWFVGLATLLSLSHGYAFLLLAALAGLTAVARGGPRAGRIARLALLAPGVAVSAWSAAYGGPPARSAGTFALVSSVDYQTIADKLSLLVTPTLMTRWGVDVAVGVVVWGVLLASLVATARERPASPDAPDARSRAHGRSLVIAAVGAAALFFALPHALLWFGFIDGRVVPTFLFVAILAARRPALGPRLSRALDVIAPGSAAAMVAIVLLASARFQAEARGFHEVLAAIPAGASVLNLPVEPDSVVFTAHPFVHYDKLAALDHDVLLSDVWPDRATALYATPENPQARLPRRYNSANLAGFDLGTVDLADWDYLLVRTRPDAGDPAPPPPYRLVKRAGGFCLFARGRPAS